MHDRETRTQTHNTKQCTTELESTSIPGGWIRATTFEGTLQGGLEGSLPGGGEVAFPFKGALETYTNTCGQEVATALSFYTTRFAASLEPCGVRMKDMN